MARVTQCDICKKNTTGNSSPRCHRCQVAVDEDFHAKLQQAFRAKQLVVMDPALKKKLCEGKFRTLEEYEATLKKEAALQRQKALWEMERNRFIQQQLREWDKKHPDPNPIRFGGSL